MTDVGAPGGSTAAGTTVGRQQQRSRSGDFDRSSTGRSASMRSVDAAGLDSSSYGALSNNRSSAASYYGTGSERGANTCEPGTGGPYSSERDRGYLSDMSSR